ncbi:hypothetical protein HYH03_002006 [Edaphochlamys debaryana]|uniref:Glycosyl transferase 48 domain-containing protein n=1 Tax=Edaphochlamys debaryana TaxID=47281 RepID=A0A835YFU6_9CHLO|nr:hypothetical protein HYH03_002006 [Edaphochlamys debaryana]|eukprot:KAG2500438.1 hypothetical protein HYH03_002006 [Edaphochlamys debaryana]
MRGLTGPIDGRRLYAAITESLEAFSNEGSGMGSAYLTKIVQPLFHFLMEQIYLLGQIKNHGMEAAVRVSYDDVTESMSHPEVVAAVLAALGCCGPLPRKAASKRVPAGDGKTDVEAGPKAKAQESIEQARRALWSRLMALGSGTEGDIPPPESLSAGPRVPLLCPALPYRDLVRPLLHGDAAAATEQRAETPNASARTQSGGSQASQAVDNELSTVVAAAVAGSETLASLQRADAGASFWVTVALRKTFVEHRSVAMPLIAFGRMVKFQLCWFYLLCAWQAWSGDHDRSRWLASTTVLHWALTVLLWSMQAILSGGVWIKRTEKSRDGKTTSTVVVPCYRGQQYKATEVTKADGGVAPPPSHGGIFWWTVQYLVLGVAWFLLAIVTWGMYKPGSDAWRWVALAYGLIVIAYELLWRQCNLGGYALPEFFETLQRLLPGGPRVTSASTGANPIFDPTIHLRTGLKYLFGNLGLWIFTLALKFVFDYLVLVKPAAPRMASIIDTNALAVHTGSNDRIASDLDILMAAMQVILLFLLSMVSTNVAYTVSTALFGCLQGTRQGLGSVRNWSQIRAGFNSHIQGQMASKICRGGDVKLLQQASGRAGPSSFGQQGPAATGASASSAGAPVAKSGHHSSFRTLHSLRRLAEDAGFLPARTGKDAAVWERREATAALMAPIWNALVRSLRQRDLLSNKELSNMSFTPPTSRCGCANGAGAAQATYLPPQAIYVAQIPQMVNGSRPSAGQLAVLQEAYVYLLSLLAAVGAVPRKSAAAAARAANEAAAAAARAVAHGNDAAAVAAAAKAAAAAATAAAAAAVGDALPLSWVQQCDARRNRRAGRKQGTAPLLPPLPATHVHGVHVEALLPEVFEAMVPHASSPSDLAARREVLGAVREVLEAMLKAVEVYETTGSGAIGVAKQDVAVEGLGTALHRLATAVQKLSHLPPALGGLLGAVVAERHFLSDHMLETMHAGLLQVLRSQASGSISLHGPSPSADDADVIPTRSDFLQVSRWLLGILASTDQGTAPASSEALGLLVDFCSTLSNPNTPPPPAVAAMRSVTTLIPHYHETVIYALSSKDAKTVLGGKVEGAMSEDEVLFVSDNAAAPKPSGLLSYLLSEFPEELLLWASVRGQVLARTVDGMSMYRTALALQAVTDALAAAEADAAPQAPAAGAELKLSKIDVDSVRKALLDHSLTCVEELADVMCRLLPPLGPLLDAKYGTLVSSQVYSTLASSSKISDRWCAHGVALLLTRYSASLRVSYLEPVDRLPVIVEPGYSYTLVQYDSALVRAVPIALELAGAGAASGPEAAANPSWSAAWLRRHNLVDLKAAETEVLFRMRQPLNMSGDGSSVILGEGKPENQNVALPYCPGVLVQTIDMNQDNSLAQALKLRNATLEFEPPANTAQQVAVLGYPEWISSYRCGLLAELAAQTERTFGTQIQRVMGFPSAVRAHYGHPDLWNKLFAMGRAGLSKSNAVQHVSEDAFGGYNALKRGGLSKYVSYISVGKGRDMGLDSILGFEGKISKGCGEQLMSRDVRFLGCHMDFFRSLSFYCTGPGHFIGTWITVFTIPAGLWVQLLLLLGSVNSDDNSIAAAIGTVQILQLGTLPLLANVFNLWMELGLASALWMLGQQLLSGGLMFHIFRSVTSAYHLGRATLFGGASYVATGRGLSLQRKTFTQVYVNYGRSHLYFGADVLLMSILILIVGSSGNYPIPAAALWSSFLVAISMLAGPFWFTPFFFRMHEVIRDAREFAAWVRGSGARGVKDSWAEWNREQLAPLRDETGIQIPRYRAWSIVTLLLPRAVTCVLGAMVAVAAAKFETQGMPDLAWVLAGSAATWLALGLWSATMRGYVVSGLKSGWRWVKATVQVVSVLVICLVLVAILFLPKRGIRFSDVMITLWANYLAASLVVLAATLLLPNNMAARSACNAALRQTDAALGLVMSVVLVILTFIGEIGLIMLDKVQTLVQFNDRFTISAAAKGSTDVVAVAPLKKE